MSSGQVGYGHCIILKKYKECCEDYDGVLEIKPDNQLGKDNQKTIKKKLSKHKTYSFE